MDEDKEDRYFVIYDKVSNTYCIVLEDKVICDASVDAGDEVSFCSGKKYIKGVVKFMHGNYNVCIEKAKELKKTEKSAPKREESFHADKPRKSSLKCKERMATATQSKRKNHADEVGNTAKKPKKTRKKESSQTSAMKKTDKELMDLIQTKHGKKSSKGKKEAASKWKNVSSKSVVPDNVEEDDDNSKLTDDESARDGEPDNREQEETGQSTETSSASSSSENEEDDEKEVRRLSAELAARYDLATLKQMAASAGQSSARASIPSSENSNEEQASTSKNSVTPVFDPAIPSSSKEDTFAENPTPPKVSPSPQPILSNKVVVFNGDMYLVKDPDQGVVLDEKNKIMCDQSIHEQAQNLSSATQVGRKLLEGVFTQEALLKCSISGMPPKGKGKSAYLERTSIKPALCPKALKSIIDAALKLQGARHWKPKKDASHIRHAMSVRLREISKKHNSDANSDDSN